MSISPHNKYNKLSSLPSTHLTSNMSVQQLKMEPIPSVAELMNLYDVDTVGVDSDSVC